MTNYLIELKNAQTSQGQSKALELFYNETVHLVFAFCRKKGITAENSEDIVQIVYTQIYKKRGQYNPDYSPLAWLFVITKSEAKDYLKKSAIYGDYVKDYGFFLEMSQTDSFNPNDKQDPLTALDLSSLNPNEKTALEQRYFDEKDFQSIAETLGVTETNARKIISRAIKKLKG